MNFEKPNLNNGQEQESLSQAEKVTREFVKQFTNNPEALQEIIKEHESEARGEHISVISEEGTDDKKIETASPDHANYVLPLMREALKRIEEGGLK